MIFYKEMRLHNLIFETVNSQSIFQRIRSTEREKGISLKQKVTQDMITGAGCVCVLQNSTVTNSLGEENSEGLKILEH